MDHLWAPWRMTYILGEDKPQGCIFCLSRTGPDPDRLVLSADETALVMMNRYPYNNGHLLVAPRRHVADPGDLTDAETLAVMGLVRRSLEVLRSEMRPEGFNVGLNLGLVAGAGVADHMHWHIVPRWNGDINYMTVLGEVRVIPEHLVATYAKLARRFAAA